MAVRTIRLNAAEEAALHSVREATGLPVSRVLKQGLRLLQEQTMSRSRSMPYDIYRQLDLGPGGGALGPAKAVRATVAAALRRKRESGRL